jgi:hypothetical protein
MIDDFPGESVFLAAKIKLRPGGMRGNSCFSKRAAANSLLTLFAYC